MTLAIEPAMLEYIRRLREVQDEFYVCYVGGPEKHLGFDLLLISKEHLTKESVRLF